MLNDPCSVAEFYATPRGAVAARLIADRLAELWPPHTLAGQSLLGFGYAAPYLPLWASGAARCVHLVTSPAAAPAWPAGRPSLSCAAHDESLPFADAAFDRVLLVHGLEVADHARRLLRDVWRVLRDDGRLLVVTPNRRGLWAHVEATPFGQGEPYSRGQIDRLLAHALFRVERRAPALFFPPLTAGALLRGARLWEDAGRRMCPQFSGLTLCDAVKDVYAAIPVAAYARRRLISAEAA